MSPCSLNHFLLLYVIHPLTAASCRFFSAISGSDVCFFLVYYCSCCSLSLSCSLSASVCLYRSHSLPVSPSITHSLCSSAVAQRQVVISALRCFSSVSMLSFFFFLLRHLSPLLTAAFLCSFFSHFSSSTTTAHHFSFFLHLLAFFSLFSLATPLPPPSHLHSLPLLMTSLLLLLSPIPRLSLSGPRMSDAAQSAPR